MTIGDLLAAQHASPLDSTTPNLFISFGVLSEDDDKHVVSAEYAGLPYVYILNILENRLQLYDNGSARYLAPIDVIVECRNEENLELVNQVWNGIFNALPFIDEIRPNVPLSSPYRYIGGYRAESRRKGFVEALLRLETTW